MKVLNRIRKLGEKVTINSRKNVHENTKKNTAYITVKVRRLQPNGQYSEWETIEKNKHNLHNTGGVDFTHYQCYTATGTGSTSSITTATIGSNYLALSTDTGAPAAGDTTLTGEISTNGLQRAQCTTLTHTASTNVTTLSKTFTASGTFTAVQKGALFNASSTGVMNHEFTFASTNLNSGDQIQLTITVTGG